MTLTTTASRVTAAGNGSTTAFTATGVKIWTASDLKVYLRDNTTLVDTLQTLTTHYSVSGTLPGIPIVTFVTAPAVGQTVVIVRDIALTQDLDLISSGAFAAENVEVQLDRIVGQIQDIKLNLDDRPATAFHDTVVTAPPIVVGNHNSATTAFSGDLTKLTFPVRHVISGVGTVGQPTSGYLYRPEVYPHYTYLDNASGWNDATASNTGRTGVAAHRTKVRQQGQGDLVAYNASAFVDSTRAGSTSFLANPAVSLFNGDLQAGVAGAYLNAGEMLLSDGGFDAAGIGWVVNLNRSVATGAKSAWWAGYRVQSTGATSADVAFSASGKFNHGLDLSFADFGTNQAAVTLKADQRIYGNVSATDVSGLNRFPASLSTSYVTYSSSLGAWHFVTANQSALQIYGNQVISPLAIRSDVEFRIATNRVVGARKLGWSSATGTATRTTFDTATITVSQLAERVKALIDDLHATAGHGLIGA